ncbi:hypothetical protein NDU88_004121 [Pleurodeles waltl]|uniref:Uncharacterized protein n=1 Tax=Pleurodeles waltl TaxID=8319 RepID=A0AAV7W5P8_PLEWA|nr:hypothetical protein NDU88_004121 [Pleurodeles waltl]
MKRQMSGPKAPEKTKEERNLQRPEFLGEKPTGSKSPHSPNLGRRSPAPGSIRLGPATLQEKRGQARHGVRDG